VNDEQERYESWQRQKQASHGYMPDPATVDRERDRIRDGWSPGERRSRCSWSHEAERVSFPEVNAVDCGIQED
jgi:hypothetical protein